MRRYRWVRLVLATAAVAPALVAVPALGTVPAPAAAAPASHVIRLGDLAPGAARPAAATAPFSAVGVTWVGAAQVTVAVRARQRQRWTAWQTVGTAEDARAGRGGSELVWFGPSTDIQLTIQTTAPISDTRVELIDPGPDPEVTTRPTATINPRAAWGADESLMTWPHEYAGPVKAVVWHHTATSNAYAQSDVPGILRSIYRFHAVSRGWGDIGYHVLADRFGQLWEGRAGGLSQPVVGAHAGGFNRQTAGIAVIGDHTATPVPAAVTEAAGRYVAWKLSLGPAADPRGGTTITGGGPLSSYPAGSTVTVPRVYPHRLTSPTDCPGARGMDALVPIRNRAYELLGDWTDPGTRRARLAVWRPGEATWHIREGGTVGGAPGDIPVRGDFDGDGASDAAVWTPSTGVWTIGGTTVRLGAAGDVPVPADLDGDGRDEPMTWTPATGMWHRPGRPDLHWGRPDDVPVTGDYNGDGRDEVAVWRPSDGGWYRLGLATLWDGAHPDIPVPADYDGDGRTDRAVWSPVTGEWKIRNRPTVSHGQSGDIPVPGQYDGDGKADRVVYRDGAWLVHGDPPVTFGQNGDLPVALF